MGTINYNSDNKEITVTSTSISWEVVVSCKTDLGLGSTGSPDYPYFAMNRLGSGTNTLSVANLQKGDYMAELAEINEGITDTVAFTISTDGGSTHKECVAGYCQEVTGVGIDTCSTVGEYCTGRTVRKELVTNLSSDETIVNVVVKSGSNIGCIYQYVGKRQEGTNWVFSYDFHDVDNCGYAELGAGAGLTKFIANNWASIAKLLVVLGVVTIVWLWRDAQTAQPEAEATISTNDTTNIGNVLDNPSLTPEQKESLIAKILQKSYSSTDWATTALYAVGILAGAYVLGTFLSRPKAK